MKYLCCQVKGCNGLGNKNKKGEYYFIKGLCQKHYKRKNLYGDVDFIKREGSNGNSKHQYYNIYLQMKQRCYNNRNSRYKNYGGRGITICDRWLGIDGFTNFCNDMGDRPIGYSIDRIDNNGNYEPSNCKWSTDNEQGKNKTNNNETVGVSYLKETNRWSSYLNVGKKRFVKYFKTEEEAIKERKSLEVLYNVK